MWKSKPLPSGMEWLGRWSNVSRTDAINQGNKTFFHIVSCLEGEDFIEEFWKNLADAQVFTPSAVRNWQPPVMFSQTDLKRMKSQRHTWDHIIAKKHDPLNVITASNRVVESMRMLRKVICSLNSMFFFSVYTLGARFTNESKCNFDITGTIKIVHLTWISRVLN